MDNDISFEENFYQRIEKADQAYYELDDPLSESLEAYFIQIYGVILDVVG